MATHLPHTPEALTGKRVRITRRGHQYHGTIRSAGPYDGSEGGLALMLDYEDVGGVARSTGFHLPGEAIVEDLTPTHVVMAPDGTTTEPLTYQEAKDVQSTLNIGRDGCDYLVVPMSPPCTPHTVAGPRGEA